MKRSFDPSVLEMMDRPQPVSAELETDLHNLRQLNRYFGSYRLIEHFLRPEACVDGLIAQVQRFGAGSARTDDATAVLIRSR